MRYRDADKLFTDSRKAWDFPYGAILRKVLADENRLAIVRMVGNCGEVCACDLLADLNISQPTLSHHMKVLCSCGIVRCRREGRWCHYSIDPQVAADLAGFFAGLTSTDGKRDSCSCGGCETCA